MKIWSLFSSIYQSSSRFYYCLKSHASKETSNRSSTFYGCWGNSINYLSECAGGDYARCWFAWWAIWTISIHLILIYQSDLTGVYCRFDRSSAWRNSNAYWFSKCWNFSSSKAWSKLFASSFQSEFKGWILLLWRLRFGYGVWTGEGILERYSWGNTNLLSTVASPSLIL